MPSTLNDWAAWVTIIGGPVTILSLFASFGFFVRRNRTLKDLIYVEQERDNLQKTAAVTEKRLKSEIALAARRLDLVDPDRFLVQVRTLNDEAKFADAEKLAIDFTAEQSTAFGLAAEILADNRILASGEFGKPAANEALRFIDIGLAADPESIRLKALRKLAIARSAAIERGEPLETLNWDGMTDVELCHLALSLLNSGDYLLAEIASRRSVPLAIMRTGEESHNVANALDTHGRCLVAIGDVASAAAIHKRVLEIDNKTNDTAQPNYATHLNNFAGVVQAQENFPEAETLYRQALEIDAKTIGTAHPDYATHLNNLAFVVGKQRRLAEAEPLYRQALAILRDRLGDAHPKTQPVAANLLDLLEAYNPSAPDIPALRTLLALPQP